MQAIVNSMRTKRATQTERMIFSFRLSILDEGVEADTAVVELNEEDEDDEEENIDEDVIGLVGVA